MPIMSSFVCGIFSIRWSAHWSTWKVGYTGGGLEDKAALLHHFYHRHFEFFNQNPDITECFKVTFLQEPQNKRHLDFNESKWISKLQAKININKTILPKFRLLLPLGVGFVLGFYFAYFGFVRRITSSIL